MRRLRLLMEQTVEMEKVVLYRHFAHPACYFGQEVGHQLSAWLTITSVSLHASDTVSMYSAEILCQFGWLRMFSLRKNICKSLSRTRLDQGLVQVICFGTSRQELPQ